MCASRLAAEVVRIVDGYPRLGTPNSISQQLRDALERRFDDRIKKWNENWVKNSRRERGWTAGFDTRREWAREGASIARLLHDELADIAVLFEYDWCLPDD